MDRNMLAIARRTNGQDTAMDFILPGEVEGPTLTGRASTGTGNAHDNVLTGNAQNNVLIGLAGEDHLAGGAGNDTYVFNEGDGQDTIDDLEGVNGISFGAGITEASLTFSQYTGNDGHAYLAIGYGTQGDTVSVKDGAYGALAEIRFDNGTVRSVGSFLNSTPGVHLAGTEGPDTMYGTAGSDLIEGKGGADTLYGGEGNDTLDAGEGPGANNLFGEAGDDTLVASRAGAPCTR